MKITNRALARLWVALLDLDGSPPSDGKPSEPYEFSGSVRYAIARNISHLRGALEILERTQQGIVRQFSAGTATVNGDDPKFQDCQLQLDLVLDEEIEVEVHRIKLADLKLDKNKLKGSTIAALDAVIAQE